MGEGGRVEERVRGGGIKVGGGGVEGGRDSERRMNK